MSGIVPSFILKKERAVTHLNYIKELISTYVSSNPYALGDRGQDDEGRIMRPLHFTQQPSDQLAIVIGDFVHNVRSACDHLVAGMAESKFWDQVRLPICDVDPFAVDPNTGELLKRREQMRRTWARITQGITKEGVAAIEALQPFHGATAEDQVHGLTVLRDLSNTDKHRHLPVLASGLAHPTVTYRFENGNTTSRVLPGHLKDGAGIEVVDTPSAVDVEVVGTPLVVARVSSEDWDVGLPLALDTVLKALTDVVSPALIPHQRPIG